MGSLYWSSSSMLKKYLRHAVWSESHFYSSLEIWSRREAESGLSPAGSVIETVEGLSSPCLRSIRGWASILNTNYWHLNNLINRFLKLHSHVLGPSFPAWISVASILCPGILIFSLVFIITSVCSSIIGSCGFLLNRCLPAFLKLSPSVFILFQAIFALFWGSV